ncbi:MULTISPECIES: hypothetical protein [Rhizobium]|uniref:Uncharacterized protein n=1 Tax=Rhizobium laguerreae TaxID=1076926 RepID=A0AAX2QE18_9HYPH|nr:MULTISPECIES: hypothetical protein [Rhizobium]MCA2411443.1 hypothetical protein [Rhizobium leguminosarum]NKK99797.1 hypothetical protein [Rhizobium leguminosarum bv. viciae]NKM94263.1 hypothetical protein [Rhizobium leguminosarum bv. viciae]TBZ35931.1 hypothetical protein E0H44_30715 [Rhizobium leguminosarum bv. viciae]TBZ65019.1 hypothetical protein E0H61_35855 [Rhizobium leguminosarum bv. viciae]
MPDFTIETTYHLPVFRHRTYQADTLDAACRAAIEDDSWDIAEKDFDSSGPIYVTGIWEGAHAAYAGPPVQIPPQFDEPVRRRARHFEILLGLLKIFFDDAHAARPPSLDWLARSAWAIARGEAILAGDPDPEEPVDPPKPSYVLVRLQESSVRDAISAVLDVDSNFRDLTPEAVTDDEVHAACLSIATTLDFSDMVGNAEFQAALLAIRSAHRRLASD